MRFATRCTRAYCGPVETIRARFCCSVFAYCWLPSCICCWSLSATRCSRCVTGVFWPCVSTSTRTPTTTAAIATAINGRAMRNPSVFFTMLPPDCALFADGSSVTAEREEQEGHPRLVDRGKRYEGDDDEAHHPAAQVLARNRARARGFRDSRNGSRGKRGPEPRVRERTLYQQHERILLGLLPLEHVRRVQDHRPSPLRRGQLGCHELRSRMSGLLRWVVHGIRSLCSDRTRHACRLLLVQRPRPGRHRFLLRLLLSYRALHRRLLAVGAQRRSHAGRALARAGRKPHRSRRNPVGALQRRRRNHYVVRPRLLRSLRSVRRSRRRGLGLARPTRVTLDASESRVRGDVTCPWT